MILAVMTRATRGHTGHLLTADVATTASYVLVTLAAVLRVTAEFIPDFHPAFLMASGVAWVSAFGFFLFHYGPMLLTERSRSARAIVR